MKTPPTQDNGIDGIDDLEDLVLRWIGGTVLGAAMVMIAGFLMSFFI